MTRKLGARLRNVPGGASQAWHVAFKKDSLPPDVSAEKRSAVVLVDFLAFILRRSSFQTSSESIP